MRPRQGGRGRAWGPLTQIIDCRDRKRDQDDHNGDDDCNQFSPTDLRGGRPPSVFSGWLLPSFTPPRPLCASSSTTRGGRRTKGGPEAFSRFRPPPPPWPGPRLHALLFWPSRI